MIYLITSKSGSAVQLFRHMKTGNQLSKMKFERGKENRLWLEFCAGHPNMHFAQACSENIVLDKFWSLTNHYLDLISRLHIQVRLMGNLCLNSGIPWLSDTEGSLCFIYKGNTETVNHHFTDCSVFKDNYSSLWSNLRIKSISFNQTDGIAMSNFIPIWIRIKKFYCCWKTRPSF